jgi:multiple sugar transport system permease protein
MATLALGQRRAARRRTLRRLGLGLFFISPWIAHFLLLNLYPMAASFYYSLTVYSVLKPPVFIGLENYLDLATNDARFAIALYNTVYYTVGAVGVGTVAAIAMAMLLNMKVRGQSIYRTVFYLPSVTPLVAASIVWLWFLNPQYGVLTTMLRFVGLPTIGWLSDPAWAKPSLILLAIWGVGNAIVIYLAGLQDVPQELYEAAQIDGANGWQQIWNITLPMLSPVILFNVIVGMIGSFQVFAQIYILTAGGPADATLMYAYYLYISAFEFFKMGYASAMAWILFLIVLLATLLIFRSSARWVYYGGEAR